MKKIILLLIFITFAISANLNYDKIVESYKKRDYKETCRYGKKILEKLDNRFLSLVGNACAKEDDINILGDIIKHLNKSKADRMNSSYFATLILEKKLICQFMNDNINLSNLSLPKTNHILSRVFDNIAKGKYKILNKKNKKIKIIDGSFTYLMWLSDNKPKRVYIDEFKNGTFVKRHWFL